MLQGGLHTSRDDILFRVACGPCDLHGLSGAEDAQHEVCCGTQEGSVRHVLHTGDERIVVLVVGQTVKDSADHGDLVGDVREACLVSLEGCEVHHSAPCGCLGCGEPASLPESSFGDLSGGLEVFELLDGLDVAGGQHAASGTHSLSRLGALTGRREQLGCTPHFA